MPPKLEMPDSWTNAHRELFRRCNHCGEVMFGIPARAKPENEIRVICEPCGGKAIEGRG
jgi:formylmethanofuran dehydrogenase subunit E